MNTKMVDMTLVKDHVLKMICHLSEIEIPGVYIDEETQVDNCCQEPTRKF